MEGLDNCLVKFAKCCTPVPGDPVVGFITRGFGVSVHRQDCPNADPAKRKPEEAGRWVKVAWGESEQTGYQTSLEISAKDREGLALDVTMALTAAKVKVQQLLRPEPARRLRPGVYCPGGQGPERAHRPHQQAQPDLRRLPGKTGHRLTAAGGL